MSLRELYQEIIVDHGKQPRHFGELPEANHHQVGHNPLCGDKLILHVEEKEGVINNAQFEGVGCAISVASASLMIEAILGKPLEDVKSLFANFYTLVTEGKEPPVDLGKLVAFKGVSEFPIRVKCATLAWRTLNAALANDPNPVSTE